MSKKVSRKKRDKKKDKLDRKKAYKNLQKKVGRGIKFNKLKQSADKGDVKALNTVLSRQTKMKELEAVRKVCNHHHRSKEAYMSVAEFRYEYPERMHLVPLLDESIKHYGEENIGICPIDMTPVISDKLLSQVELEKSFVYTYLVSNTLKGAVKLSKKKGMPLIYKFQNSILESFMFLRKKLAKIMPADENQKIKGGFSVRSHEIDNATKASATAAVRRSSVGSDD